MDQRESQRESERARESKSEPEWTRERAAHDNEREIGSQSATTVNGHKMELKHTKR